MAKIEVKKIELKYSRYAHEVLDKAMEFANISKHEYLTPEHMLLAMLHTPVFSEALERLGADTERVTVNIAMYVTKYEKRKEGRLPEMSKQFRDIMINCLLVTARGETDVITISTFAESILKLENSYAATILINSIDNKQQLFLDALKELSGENDSPCTPLPQEQIDEITEGLKANCIRIAPDTQAVNDFIKKMKDDSNSQDDQDEGLEMFDKKIGSMFTPVLLDKEEVGQIVKRTDVTDKILTSLSRLNNKSVLVVGARGVGKTYLKYALVCEMLLTKSRRFKNCYIVQYDPSTAGGIGPFKPDNEERMFHFNKALEKNHAKAIVFVDDLHKNISTNPNMDSGNELANLLAPLMNSKNIFLVCTINEDELIHSASHIGNLLPMFQRVNMTEAEPAAIECMVAAAASRISKHHRVKIEESALEAAIDLSKRYIKESALPAKAIDIIDEACGIAEIVRHKRLVKDVDIANAISVKYNIKGISETSIGELNNLSKRLKSRIYGQDQAIDAVVNAVHIWKAGLNEDEKPIANMLFVGPTGVGKTEIAKALAEEMGVKLVRFDMSEYVEKHTVSKLLGSPAGYIGYEEGGLLTTAIMKSPNCVLLLDEIEKAHQDIYNVMLQIMDYGCLTDSKGQKVNFQNVFIIMTSNAGAQYAHMSSMGYASRNTEGSSMIAEVKKTFKPEFINRLSAQVVFNSMDKTMANMILDKKLDEFRAKLERKNIKMKVSAEAHEWILAKGFTKEYGAREMDRVITSSLKPLFVQEIVFGDLKNGGEAIVNLAGDALHIKAKAKQPEGKKAVEKKATGKKTTAKKAEAEDSAGKEK